MQALMLVKQLVQKHVNLRRFHQKRNYLLLYDQRTVFHTIFKNEPKCFSQNMVIHIPHKALMFNILLALTRIMTKEAVAIHTSKSPSPIYCSHFY